MAVIKRSVVVEAPVGFVFSECRAIDPGTVFAKFGGGALQLAGASESGHTLCWNGRNNGPARMAIGIQAVEGTDKSSMTWQFEVPAPGAEQLRAMSVTLDLELRAMREAMERAWVATQARGG